MIEGYDNYEWYLNQDLQKYSGRWLAIIDKKIVGSSKDFKMLMKRVEKQYPKKKPLITKVNNHLSVL